MEGTLGGKQGRRPERLKHRKNLLRGGERGFIGARMKKSKGGEKRPEKQRRLPGSSSICTEDGNEKRAS